MVNEHLNDCETIEDGERKRVSAMQWLETVYIGRVKPEAFTTSGGLGTMCDIYLGTVANLDYITLRYRFAAPISTGQATTLPWARKPRSAA